MHRGIFTIGTILIPLGGGGCYVALQIHPDHPGSVSEVAAWVSGAALAASGLTAALLGAAFLCVEIGTLGWTRTSARSLGNRSSIR